MRTSAPLLVIFFGVLTSCRQVAPVGKSSFAIVNELGVPPPAPADASQLKLAESMSIVVPPKPMPPLATPKYPVPALAAGLRDVQMAVTITIDSRGKVIDIAPSLARLPYTTAFHEEFLAAIAAAVRTWRFEPGQLAHLEPQADGRPLATSMDAVESQLTVAFVFSQSGKVRSELRQQK